MQRCFPISQRSVFILFTAICIITTLISLSLVTMQMYEDSLSLNLAELTPSSESLAMKWQNFTTDLRNDETIEISHSSMLNSSEGSDLSNRSEVLWSDFEVAFRNLRLNYSMTASLSSSTVNLCSDGQNGENATKLFVFIPTRASDFERRANIRDSWAARNETMSINAVVKFVVGRTKDPLIADILYSELLTLNDLIISDIPDTYENLFLKVYLALQWQAEYCKSAAFVLKVDDDAIVDLGRLNYWLNHEFARHTANKSAVIFGLLWRGARPTRKPGHKWYVPKSIYKGRIYPKYANGPTYMMTADAARRILHVSENVSAFSIEDVLFTGVLAEAAGVPRRHAEKFFRGGSTLFHGERCGNSVPYVSAVYGLSAAQIPDGYRMLRNVDCRSEWTHEVPEMSQHLQRRLLSQRSIAVKRLSSRLH